MESREFKPDEILSHLKADNFKMFLTGDFHDELLTVNPTLSHNITTEITDIISDGISKYRGYIIENYNIIGANDDIVEIALASNYNDKLQRIFQSCKNPESIEALEKHMDLFQFYTFRYHDPKNGNDCSDDVYVFRRINKMRAIRKGILLSRIEDKFKKIDSNELFGIDKIIDFVYFKGDIYIFNHVSLERILKLADIFKAEAEKTLENKVFEQNIINFDNFKEEALENRNHTRRLAKIGKKVSILFLTKINNTKKIIEEFNLDIEVKDDKLVYRDKTQVGNFINGRLQEIT